MEKQVLDYNKKLKELIEERKEIIHEIFKLKDKALEEYDKVFKKEIIA